MGWVWEMSRIGLRPSREKCELVAATNARQAQHWPCPAVEIKGFCDGVWGMQARSSVPQEGMAFGAVLPPAQYCPQRPAHLCSAGAQSIERAAPPAASVSMLGCHCFFFFCARPPKRAWLAPCVAHSPDGLKERGGRPGQAAYAGGSQLGYPCP